MSHPPAYLARAVTALLAALCVVAGSALVSPAPAGALPPGIPSASSAQSQLNALPVRAEGSMSGYSRDRFPHWITITGTCNAREQVLKRDGTNVVVNSSCAATSRRSGPPSNPPSAVVRRPRSCDARSYAGSPAAADPSGRVLTACGGRVGAS